MQRSNQKLRVTIIIMLIITVMNLTTTLYSRGRQSPRQNEASDRAQISEKVKELKGRFPLADYDAPEPAEPQKRAVRKARNERHNKSMLGVKGGLNAPSDSGDEIVLRTDWEVNTPPIPAALSDVVLIGEISDANAYVSADKNGVYSEFTLRVEQVLKAVAPSAHVKGVVTVERQGGRVRYPSGRVEWYRIALQEIPLVNRRYVLFLKRIDEDSFSIVTGYELRDGHVYALDGGASQFAAYNGTDEASFLQLVREAIAKW